MKKLHLIITSLFLLIGIALHSQSVGVGTETPDSSAILDIQSTDKGMLVPRINLVDVMNDSFPVHDPATGLMVWNTNDTIAGGFGAGFYYFNGISWQAIKTEPDTSLHLKCHPDDHSFTEAAQEIIGGSIFFSTIWQEILVNNAGYLYTFDINIGGIGSFDGGWYRIEKQLPDNSWEVIFQEDVSTMSSGWNTLSAPMDVHFSSGDFLKFVLHETTGNFQGRFAPNNPYPDGESKVGGKDLTFRLNLTTCAPFSQSIPVLSLENGNVILDIDTIIATTYIGDGSGLTNLPSEDLITDADNNTKIQVEESADENLIRFDIGGVEYFRMDSGRLEVLNTGGSVIIGENAGASDNLSNNNNVFIGNESGRVNINGFRNTANGARSLKSNIAGSANVASGYEALRDNTGSSNTGVGAWALSSNSSGENNVSLGRGANSSNTIGNKNIAIGSFALGANVSGSRNVAIGIGALNLVGGSRANNTAIGYEAGYEADGSNNVFIGHQAGKNKDVSERLYIDNSSTAAPLIYGEFDNDKLEINGSTTLNASSGDLDFRVQSQGDTSAFFMDASTSRVGIGTDTPSKALEVVGSAQLTEDDPELIFKDESVTLGFRKSAIRNHLNGALNIPPITASDQNMTFHVSNNTTNGMAEVMRLRGDGNVGIGETDPAHALDVSGDINASGTIMENGNALLPVGTVVMWMGTTIPTNWLSCNGGTFVQGTYPDLYAVLGNSTTLPDLRGRFPLGVGRSNENGNTMHFLKDAGGEETHTLTISEMPAHTHGIQYREGEEQGSGNDYSDLGDTGVNDSTQSRGGGQEHNNMPSFYTMHFIIKAN